MICASPTDATASPAPTLSAPPPGRAWPAFGCWDSEQVGQAATIVTVGAQRGVPPRGWVIALATAMQESGLRNLPGGPDDSIEPFQQRPSQSWGTPAQLTDPAYAAGRFYNAMLAVPNWQSMALTDAAQAVQRSAFPDAYAKWEADASALAFTLTGTAGDCTVQVGEAGSPPSTPRSCPASARLSAPPSAGTRRPVTIDDDTGLLERTLVALGRPARKATRSAPWPVAVSRGVRSHRT